MRRTIGGVVAALGLAMGTTAQAGWWRLLEEDFSSEPSNRWTYAGVTNGGGQALFRYDGANQRIAGEWSQANVFAVGDPYVILPSVLGRSLDRVLTDRDTFRMGATVRVAAGAITDTEEFFQIANFGLYNLAEDSWGADRGQSDYYSGNATLVRDANNLVEFNYFINNRSGGYYNPFIQATLIAAMPANELDSTPYFVTGTGSDLMFHNTDMGPDTYLPSGTNLYVEIVYHGAATGQVARRVFCGIYTEPERTNLLTVGGVPMYYWTKPAPVDRTFRLSHAALLNWPSVNFTVAFGGSTPDGAGAGDYDDVYVDLNLAPAQLYAARPQADGAVFHFATRPGRSYAIRETASLLSGAWTTSAVVVASSEVASWTSGVATARGIFSIEELP